MQLNSTITSSETDFVRRKWWIAALLTLFLGGTGYLYAGHPKRFAFFVTIALFLAAIFGLIGFRSGINPQTILVFVFVSILALALAFIDSSVVAYKQINYKKQWFNKWWVYVICYLLLAGITQLTNYKSFTAIHSFYIASLSMEPALVKGDYVWVDTYAYSKSSPKRGDIAVFRLPKKPNAVGILRILGRPGDTIQFKKGIVLLNDKPLKTIKVGQRIKVQFGTRKVFKTNRETLPSGQSYLVYDLLNFDSDYYSNTKVFHVPVGHYFVAGDNRDNSTDSRFARPGFIAQKNIYAKVKIVFFSKDFKRIGTIVK